MSLGDTARPPLAIPPMIEPLSDDNGSSPLSEVEDADGEELDQLDLGDRDEADQDNDTEAETERLHDTPHNPRRVVMNQFNEQVFERTPTKLRQEKTTHSGDDDEDDDEPLSEEESIASSPPIRAQDSTVVTDAEKLQSPTLDMLAEAVAQEAENRKRKRSSHPAEQPDIELSPRKRPSPEIPVVQGDGDGDVAMADEEEEASTNTNSGEHSADEGVDATIPPETRGQAEQPDDQEAEVEIRKQTRSGSRKQRGPVDEKTVDGNEHGAAPNHAAIEEDSAPTGDEHMVDVDEEAEAAHRNEEELERKRTAFEQLTSIEERFAAFRTKFYDEKLEQLNQEEAALRSDNPTHPEYLAMMQCIDARRDEKLRIAEKELELNMEALERWAVARRSQVHSQFYQSVRESRERTLAELGQHWYDIQHERRKHANNVPDFGIRYPQSHNQRIRNALAYNKEVSILSGIAKYEGMPAAPNMCGASLQELDDDFEAMTRGRQPNPQPQRLPRSVYADYGGLPFGQGLGAAGEEWLEQTAWANPGRQSHGHIPQIPPGQQESRKRSPLPEAQANRHSNQLHPFSSSTISNVSNHVSTFQQEHKNPTAQKNAQRQPTNSPEVTRAASLLEQTSARSKAAAAAAAAEQGPTVKHETVQPVGGF